MPLDLFTLGDPIADTKAPLDVPLPERWSERKFRTRLVNPANRRKLTVIVVAALLCVSVPPRRWRPASPRSRSPTAAARRPR